MTEQTIPPCPVCGSAEDVGEILTTQHRYCSPCGLMLTFATWTRLSRAAALLRAVEGLERRQATISAGVILDEWHVGADWNVRVSSSLADALIALASEVER